MKGIFLLLFFFVSWASSQPETKDKTPQPCEHPVIKKAQTEGLNSLTLKEIPQFWFMAFQCKRQAKKAGEKINFRSLYKQKQQQNFEEARQLSGIGTCCLVVTALILSYSYLGHVIGAD